MLATLALAMVVAKTFLAPKFIVLYVLILCGMYIHFRGSVRHRLKRQLTDHSTFMSPYNCLIYLFSAASRKPILDLKDFSELQVLQDNWETIRDEASRLYSGGHIQVSANHSDVAFNTFFKRGWKRFYLKWYGDTLTSAKELCPQTVAMVEKIPSINAALFASLEPHSKLGEHRDPFAGSLRYHLGLMTPNSDACRIYIDGTPYAWRDGQAVLFDETYIHSVNNDTDQRRIILFCDVARPLHTPVARAINEFVTRHVVKITASQNMPGEKIGVINRIARHVFSLKETFQRIKKWNRKVYYLGKYAALAGLVYLLFIAGFMHRRP